MAQQPRPAPPGDGLFASGTIRLFGREFAGLVISEQHLGIDPSTNNPLLTSIAQKAQNPETKPRLARIYGFSYLGNYFKLAEPIIYMVFGPGEAVPSGYPEPEISAREMGAEYKGGDFTSDVRVWRADQLDIGLRIDITIGWLNDILLSQEMGSDNNITGGVGLRRADIVGHDGSLVGRDGSLVGRDGSLVGRDGSLIGRDGSLLARSRR
jgi:hypothetical protein